jgi:prepilin-type N-terminal cleavage/methylation domain-containing protein
MTDSWTDGKAKWIGRNKPTIQLSSIPPVRSSGFTLVELLVVIVIITVIAGIGIPTIESMTSPKYALRKQGRRVMKLMAEARATAMAQKVRTEIRFNPQAKEVFISGDYGAKTISLDDEIEIDALTSEEPDDESTNVLAVAFAHFGGSDGGGVGLSKGGIRYEFIADVLTGRATAQRAKEGDDD